MHVHLIGQGHTNRIVITCARIGPLLAVHSGSGLTLYYISVSCLLYVKFEDLLGLL